MSDNNETQLPPLSPEQEELLRARFRRELEAEKVAAKPPEKNTEIDEYVVTNVTNSNLMIPDLGIAVPGGDFSQEVFAPYETKNLRTIYKAKEIRNSKYLARCLEDGQLKKGRIPKHEIVRVQDPLEILVQQNPTGTFQDPLSGDGVNPGSRYFDEKLHELHKRDRKEDEATRKK